MSVLIIGAGPAGMSAAIACADAGCDVELWERNEKAGKKLYLTGKGRCNLTNSCTVGEFLPNVVDNPKFVISALNRTTPADTVRFFNDQGLRTKVERGRRVFPESDHSSDVIRCFVGVLNARGVRLCLNRRVQSISFRDGFVYVTSEDGVQREFDAVVVATGGISYSATGSTGDGYVFAESAGHAIIPPKAALTGLLVKGAVTAPMSGLALKNSSLTIYRGNKKLYENTGELLFTHKGLSGAIAISASSYINRLPDFNGVKAVIDLKPYADYEETDKRLLRIFEDNKNKDFVNILGEFLPHSIIPYIAKECGIDPHKKVNSVTQNERQRLARCIKELTFDIVGLEDVDSAIVTSGGVKVSEVNPTDMQSKLQSGLFFAGEVLDIAALTGGYNIQLAISTGVAAGLGAAHYVALRQ